MQRMVLELTSGTKCVYYKLSMASPSGQSYQNLLKVLTDPVLGSVEYIGNQLSSFDIVKAEESIVSAGADLFQEIRGSNEQQTRKGLASAGELTGFQKPNEKLELLETQRWIQNLQADQAMESQKATLKVIEHYEVDAGIQGMSTPEKNKILNYQPNYENIKHPYQLAQLRIAIIAQRRVAEATKKAESIPVPKGKAPIGTGVDLEAMGEGGRGRGGSVISAAVTAG